MFRNEDRKQRLSITDSIMLSVEMTRAALRLIEGGDFPWTHADITAEPVRNGRRIIDLNILKRRSGSKDMEATNDEVLRTVRIRGILLGGQDGFAQFESQCELYRYSPIGWEPRFVDVKIGKTNRHFYYINEWREDGYHSTIKETSSVTTALINNLHNKD